MLLIVIAAFASGSGGSDGSNGSSDEKSSDGIPADTPPDLRDPLQDLHDAVLGAGQ